MCVCRKCSTNTESRHVRSDTLPTHGERVVELRSSERQLVLRTLPARVPSVPAPQEPVNG